jgi:hypothetical protein
VDPSSPAPPAPRSEHRPAPREVLATWAAPRRNALYAIAAVLLVLGAWRLGTSGAAEATREASLAAVLARDGVRVAPATIVWLADDAGWGMRPALFLAHREGELDDVWYAEARPGREGALVDVVSVANLTQSAAAVEEQLVVAGERAAFVSRAGDVAEALTILDLRGEGEIGELTRVQRVQHEITNIQETGRARGFGRVRWQLAQTSQRAELSVVGGRFVLALDGGTLAIDPARDAEAAEGAELASAERSSPGVPGGITWVVDTVRGLSFVGPEPIEWLENRVFAVQDLWDRTRHSLFGSEDTADAVAADLGTTPEATMTEERRALLTAQEAEVGFPPPPLDVVLRNDPVEGEGEWIPVIDDPFVNQYPGAPPAFVQSFVRPDDDRPYVRVYVTMWDPRQVQLRIVSGTREPQSATGQFGTGYIPRDERTLRTLVGAFNGGFQALHGEFGMMASGRVYLPPKPWAATVAVFDDGRVGMGSWPPPNWRGQYFDERLANRQIPEGMIDMRQNLTSMVEDGVWNPWQRWWWGAAPVTEEEQTYTFRSGLCLTGEGFLAFFWGSSLGPEELARAMISARCARAMHLDMNSGHCGFEFFRPYSPGTIEAPALDRRVHEEYEVDTDLQGAPGWRVRGRKAVRSMAMRFPRYTEHDARDFFYLTLRPVLPGPPLAGATDGEGAFSSSGLPHAGWPYAFARARSGGAWVVRIDPRRAVPSPIREMRHVRVLGGLTGAVAPMPGLAAVFARRAEVGHELVVGTPSPDDQPIVHGRRLGDVPDADAAIGVDRDGFLVYAEGEGVGEALARAGVGDAIALGEGSRLALAIEGGAAAPDGETEREIPEGAQLLFYAEEQPAAEVIFPDTEPRPYGHWGYLQGQRVRYFPDHPPRFVRDAGVPR